MFCDKDGRLWVGTAKGLDRYDYTTGHFVHYPFQGNASPRVTYITQLES
jgi:ligand-binding sensor domain-containing protein